MQASELALVRGISDTRETLDAWNDRPLPVLGRWFAASLAITTLLLGAIWLIATLSVPDDLWTFNFQSLREHAGLEDVLQVLGRNALVLALHALACVAGFIAGSSLPVEAERHSGVWRWVHEKAGPLAIAFVMAATAFSLMTQAVVLGQGTATLAHHFDVTTGVLLVGLLPHAVPELVALFLPLAAWMIASRQGDWHELLAATVVTVLIATPILIAAAFVEVYLSPGILRGLGGS